MNKLKRIITADMANYIASQAAAEWLTGVTPTHILRRDRGPKPASNNFPQECSGLAAIKTSLSPLPYVKPCSRAQAYIHQARVMNQAFISIAGLSSPTDERNGNLRSREYGSVSYGFLIFVRDITRTSRIIRSIVSNEHESLNLSFDLMDVAVSLFLRPDLQTRIFSLAEDIMAQGKVEAAGIEARMSGMEVYRSTFPEVPISWSFEGGLSVNRKWARANSEQIAA